MSANRPYHEADIVAEYGDALRAAGLRLKTAPVMDGQWHRAPVEGDRGAEKSGRYRGYLTGIRPAGFIENFRDPTKTGRWKSGAIPTHMSAADRAGAKQQMAAAKATAERETVARLAALARRSSADWDRAAPAPANHPYLARKRISADGLRVDSQGHLLVPLRDFDGDLRCLQTIAADGSKLFPLGAKVHGLHLLLGEIQPGGVLLVAEGYATAATLHAATGYATAVAFSKTNFIAIARVYSERLTGLRVAFCGDNDHHHPRRTPPLPNVGQVAAQEAAEATDGVAITPQFKSHDRGTDWNDWAEVHGPDAVRVAIEAALPPPPLKPHFPAPTATLPEAMKAQRNAVENYLADAAKHVAIKQDLRRRLDAIDLQMPPKSPGRRAALRAMRADMAAAHGPDWLTPGRLVLLPGAAGGGKTHLTSSEIARRATTLGRLNFHTDTLDNAVAVAVKIPGAKVARGRSATDPKSPIGAKMCLRHKAAEAVARAGLPVSTTMCRDADGRTCTMHGSCGYQREAAAMRSGETGITVGSHEYLTLNGGMPAPDVVIVDENCLPALISHMEFGLDRLLPTEMPNWQAAGLSEAAAYRAVMLRVTKAVQDPAGILAGLRVEGIDQPEDLAPAVAYLRAVEDTEFTADITPTTPDAEVLDKLDRYAKAEIRGVLKLLTALQAEIGLARDDAHGVAYHPDKLVKIGDRKERQNRISVHYVKKLAVAADVPVMLLDASGDAEIYRRLFGARLEVIEGALCERNVEVVQIGDVTNAMSTLTGNNQHGEPRSEKGAARAARLRGEIAAAAHALATKHGGTFMLATNMAVEDIVNDERPKNGMTDAVVTAHFGKLRGRNDYEECSAGMLLGRNQPPAWAMENIARAIWATDPNLLYLPGAYIRATRGIRMRDGSAHAVEVDVHPDPRVQRVLELHRERESEQAADRLRLIHNPTRKTLYVASNVPMDITVDRVVTQKQFIRETTGLLDNRQKGKGRRLYANRLVEAFRLSGGVLPLSRTELFRLSQDNSSNFKGLWGSEWVVQDELKMVDSAMEILLAESTILGITTIRYRLAGQRCPSKALVSRDLPDGRAALQALLGKPVVAYEAEGDPEPPDPPRPSPPSPPEPASLRYSEASMTPVTPPAAPIKAAAAQVLPLPRQAATAVAQPIFLDPGAVMRTSVETMRARLAAASAKLEAACPTKPERDAAGAVRVRVLRNSPATTGGGFAPGPHPRAPAED